MQVTKHVHALKIPFKINISPEVSLDRFVYTFLIYGKEITLIDSGVASAEPVIFDYVRKTGRNPEEITKLVLTHSHPDHIGAALALKMVTGCTIFAHPGEKNWIEDVELQFRERPVPGFHTLVGGSIPVDRILEEGNTLDLGDGLRLEVYHTPGHSKGSISLLLSDEGVLFSGDAIPVAGDMPIYEDFRSSLESVNKLKRINGINFLLAAWDEPRQGERVYQLMDEGLAYLERIQEAVGKVVSENNPLEPMELCKRVADKLGMPPATVTPLLARSFRANLEEMGKPRII